MKSFKLEKSENTNDSASAVGALLIILGIVVALLFHFTIGLGMVGLGVIALLAGKYAS